MKTYYVYIMASRSRTLYTGVTSNLERRAFEHKNHLVDGFTKKYKINRLVYYEETSSVESAIFREKQIKSWRREKKLDLINAANPAWNDIAENWFEEQIPRCARNDRQEQIPRCARNDRQSRNDRDDRQSWKDRGALS